MTGTSWGLGKEERKRGDDRPAPQKISVYERKRERKQSQSSPSVAVHFNRGEEFGADEGCLLSFRGHHPGPVLCIRGAGLDPFANGKKRGNNKEKDRIKFGCG